MGDAIQKTSFTPTGSYNGSKISEEFGVMVVVPNYREGALGFLASSHGHSGSSGDALSPALPIVDQPRSSVASLYTHLFAM